LVIKSTLIIYNYSLFLHDALPILCHLVIIVGDGEILIFREFFGRTKMLDAVLPGAETTQRTGIGPTIRNHVEQQHKEKNERHTGDQKSTRLNSSHVKI